jgi:hypothetical protein
LINIIEEKSAKKREFKKGITKDEIALNKTLLGGMLVAHGKEPTPFDALHIIERKTLL